MATKPSMKFIATTSDKLGTIEVKAGQVIFCSDTRVIYLDTDKRTTYQAIINVVDEQTRQAIETPIQGYYYVRKENTLWSYFDTWVQMTGYSSSLLFVETLPQIGEEDVIYVVGNKMYRYDATTSAYTTVGGTDMDWEAYQS